VEQFALKHVDFIKMDIEGYELQALAGANATIRKMRPRIMFEVNRRASERHNASPAMLRDFFLSHGYQLFRAERRNLTMIADIGKGPNYFNVFALP
jgi:hypothetical protein